MQKATPVIQTCNPAVNRLSIGFTTHVSLAPDESHPFADGPDISLLPTKLPVIDPEIIKAYGGNEVDLKNGETAFNEGDAATHYFQVLNGSIKMVTVSAEGKEFIQGVFKAGDSFGEPPLFCDFAYPSSAVTMGPCTLLKLPKEKFFTLLREKFEVHLLLNRLLCQRLRYKSMVLAEISSYDPEHRIMSLLNYLKSEFRSSPDGKGLQFRSENKYIIPYTRQQLADMSGLRVETVIRSVKKMDREGKVSLVGRKITL